MYLHAMPSKQKHRGQHANDSKLFALKKIPILNQAVSDLSYLLSRGYSENGALKLVGDRYRLTQRQRNALLRSSCSDQALANRLAKEIAEEAVKDQPVIIDGYNLLITVESGLAGGIILDCRDNSFRDIASLHGTYRRVEETMPALKIIGKEINELGIKEAKFYLDRPVSNSGRLKRLMLEMAEEEGFNWEVELNNNPDKVIVQHPEIITISADSWVIDHCEKWFNLHRRIIQGFPHANIIPMNGEKDQ
ncbi:MAG: DUF434 domain-containing protein [Bacteroidia bacterium]